MACGGESVFVLFRLIFLLLERRKRVEREVSVRGHESCEPTVRSARVVKSAYWLANKAAAIENALLQLCGCVSRKSIRYIRKVTSATSARFYYCSFTKLWKIGFRVSRRVR